MKKSKKIYTLLTAFIFMIILAITMISSRQNSKKQFVDYYSIAELYEQDHNWRSARSAWLLAKANADSISQTMSEANGRQAYCDYRIGMTFSREGNRNQAVANIQLALTTQVSDINSFMGHNGATEMKNDLSDIIDSAN
jgi:hypothetical protein